MDLSIIIPCYNEGEKMVQNTRKIVEFMQSFKDTYEIIIVNDGSKDNTLEFLKNQVTILTNNKKTARQNCLAVMSI